MGRSEVSALLESSAFEGVSARMMGMRSHEALGRPFSLEIDLTLADRDFDVTTLLGRDLSLAITRWDVERRWVGLIERVIEGRSPAGAEEVHVSVVVVPALRLLAMQRDTRIFQEQSVPEILESVLAEALGHYGRSVRFELDATYHPREYCVQYQESDLDFVHRLMEEEGIAYHFDHLGEVEELVVVDTNAAYPVAETRADDGEVVFTAHEGVAVREDVFYFEPRLAEVTTQVTVADFDWTQGMLPLSETAEGEDTRGRTRERYEHGIGKQLQIGSYDEGIRRYQRHNAPEQASLRQEEMRLAADTARGGSRAVGFAPGRTMTLSGHPVVGVDDEYLITSVHHIAAGSEEGSDTSLVYYNHFECVPSEVPFRPTRRTPKPRVRGVETAVVTGPAGEEIHTDEHGRIKVQFHWDRENPSDETSSMWLRVKQEWAGAGWGFVWIPRIGMEVIVHFIDGDPDRPLVTGSVYDAANPTPYGLPDEKTKSTIKSNTSLGGGGFNELRFEDEAGDEEIFVHAQKDYNEVVLNDHTTRVHNDQRIHVDRNQDQTVGVDQFERVDIDQTMTVHGDRKVHVGGDFDETVDGTETRHTVGDVTETFEANETRVIGADVTEKIGADETRVMGGDQRETIGGSHTSTVGGDASLTVSGALTQTIAGGITTLTPDAYDATAVGGWSVTAAAGITMVAPAGAELIFPGGVTRVDSIWELMAGKETAIGNISLTVFGLSISLTGQSIEAAGLDLDFCTSSDSTDGIKLAQKSMEAETAGAENDTGGPDVAVAANHTDA